MASLQSADRNARRSAELDLADVLRWCVAQLRPVAEEREIALTADLEPACGVVVEDHMKMLFSNVLSNAVTYSHRGGRIEVRCAQSNGNYPVVTVLDHGIGISPESLPRIFEAYYRAEEAARHRKESTGLGLAIVRQIAETYGIGVHVDSAPGRGTRFTLHFRRPPHPTGETPEGGRLWPT